MSTITRREPQNVAWDAPTAILDDVAVPYKNLELASDRRTNFKEYTSDQAPSGWTARWVTTGVNWRVREDNQVIGGKKLRAEMTGTTNARRGLSWFSAENVDIYCRSNSTHYDPSATDMTHQGIFVRGSGNAASEQMYILLLRRADTTGSEKIQIAKYIAGTQTAIADKVFAWVGKGFLWLRFQVKGNALKAKVWSGEKEDEPANWDISTTDNNISGSGWCGVFAFYSQGSTHRYDFDVYYTDHYSVQSGYRISPDLDLTDAGLYESSRISWQADIPDDTDLKVFAAITNGDEPESEDWEKIENGDPIPGLVSEQDLTGLVLWIKAELETDDSTISPELSSLLVEINKKVVVLSGAGLFFCHG